MSQVESYSYQNPVPLEQGPVERLIDHFPIMSDVLEGYEDRVFLYRADASLAGTFKNRGARRAIHHYYDHGDRRFVVPSAGNALRGAISVAAPLGVELVGVVPTSAPEEKKTGARELWIQAGGHPDDMTLVTHGQVFDDAYAHAKNYIHHRLIEPFDDPQVIAGQGELADEIMNTLPNTRYVIGAVGGLGLGAGLTQRFAQLDTNVETLLAEARGSNSASKTLRSGSEIPLPADNPNRRYGGLCVDRIGHHCLKVMRAHDFDPSNITTAHDQDVEQLADSYETHDRHYLEPSSLVAVGGLINFVNQRRLGPSGDVVVIGTGHNEHPSRLSQHPRGSKLHIASAQILRG